jgi:hypothetical protein
MPPSDTSKNYEHVYVALARGFAALVLLVKLR